MTGGAGTFWYLRERNKSLETAAEVPTFLPESTNTRELSGEEVYKRLLRSTAWIVTPRGLGNRTAIGSGVLIDHSRRLVLTNVHVVGDNNKVAVLFPIYDRDNQVIADPRSTWIEQKRASRPPRCSRNARSATSQPFN